MLSFRKTNGSIPRKLPNGRRDEEQTFLNSYDPSGYDLASEPVLKTSYAYKKKNMYFIADFVSNLFHFWKSGTGSDVLKVSLTNTSRLNILWQAQKYNLNFRIRQPLQILKKERIVT